jgi:quinol monooxygenase YgiN
MPKEQGMGAGAAGASRPADDLPPLSYPDPPRRTPVIHVIATIQLAPGTRKAFLEEFRRLTPHVRAEAGCLEYAATVDEPTPIPVQELAGEDTVVVVEKWDSVATLQDHLKAPHMADYRIRVQDFVRSVSLRVLRPA